MERSTGNRFYPLPTRILNSRPVIQEVWIEPKVAYVTDRLKANLKSSDQDGDFIYYTYQWEKNGAILNEEREEFLEKDRFKKGDVIAVLVTPDDRETSGVTKRSETLTLFEQPTSHSLFPSHFCRKDNLIFIRSEPMIRIMIRLPIP